MKIAKFMLALMLLTALGIAPVYAGDFETGYSPPPVYAPSQDQGQTSTNQNWNTQGQTLNYAPHSENNDNTNIGAWPYPNSYPAVPGPQIPMGDQMYNNQYNESASGEIFDSLPPVITRSQIMGYYRDLQATDPEMSEIVGKNIKGRTFNLDRYQSTNEVVPIPPHVLKQFRNGIDYVAFGREVSRTTHVELYREDLVIRDILDVMDAGGDGITPTGEWSAVIFKNNSKAGGILVNLAKIFTGSILGVGGGGGFSASYGEHYAQKFPNLRVKGIKIFNPALRDWWKAQPPQAPPVVKERYEEIVECPLPEEPNRTLRFEQGKIHLKKRAQSQDPQQRMAELDHAQLNFDQAIRDGIKGDRLKEAHWYLAGIWRVKYEMAKESRNPKEQAFYDQMIAHGKKSGRSDVPNF